MWAKFRSRGDILFLRYCCLTCYIVVLHADFFVSNENRGGRLLLHLQAGYESLEKKEDRRNLGWEVCTGSGRDLEARVESASMGGDDADAQAIPQESACGVPCL
jgi:hypothetical protein